METSDRVGSGARIRYFYLIVDTHEKTQTEESEPHY